MLPFLEQTDLDSADPPLVGGTSPWWVDGGSMAPEVGLLSHNIIIQGECLPSYCVCLYVEHMHLPIIISRCLVTVSINLAVSYSDYSLILICWNSVT